MTGPRYSGSRVTVKQVAEAAGVATSSVSRVFARHPDTSKMMRTRVLDAARKLGYEPDLVARGLRSGRTATIGFVVRDISSPLFGDIVKGAESALRRRRLLDPARQLGRRRRPGCGSYPPLQSPPRGWAHPLARIRVQPVDPAGSGRSERAGRVARPEGPGVWTGSGSPPCCASIERESAAPWVR